MWFLWFYIFNTIMLQVKDYCKVPYLSANIDGGLEKNSFEMIPEWLNKRCWNNNVRQCIPYASNNHFYSASKITYIVSGGALNSTHSLTQQLKRLGYEHSTTRRLVSIWTQSVNSIKMHTVLANAAIPRPFFSKWLSITEIGKDDSFASGILTLYRSKLSCSLRSIATNKEICG